MKFYYAPGTCALAQHIVINELGLDCEKIKVNLQSKQTEHHEDYMGINSKGYVPALVLDNGEVLTEGMVISQYLADLKPEFGLLPKHGDFQRWRVLEWLSFIGEELQKMFKPFFRNGTEEMKQASLTQLERHLPQLDKVLSKQVYLLGEQFTIADAQLFIVLDWIKLLKLPIQLTESVEKYFVRILERESVKKAIKLEKGC